MRRARGARGAGAAATCEPLVSVVVVYWNTPDLVSACLAAIDAGLAGIEHELIVVDNGSRPDRRLDPAASRGATVLRNAHNIGFAAAANRGARSARAPYLLFLNSDVRLTPGSVGLLVGRLMHRPWLAALAPIALGAAGERRSPALRFLTPLNHARALLGLGGRLAGTDGSGVVTCDWLRASTLLVRARPFAELGGFDEGFFFYEEDEDLCWRLARRGWEVAVDGDVAVHDPGGKTTELAGDWPARALYRGQLRFVRRRFGAAGAVAYRLAVTAALVLKVIRRTLPRRRRAAVALRRGAIGGVVAALWKSPATVPTTEA